MTPAIVYSRHYNISLFGMERLHPFDSRKFGRAWRVLRRHFGRQLDAMSVRPPGPADPQLLQAIHRSDYLDKLGSPRYVAQALELPFVARLPAWLIDWRILRPMRWATMGTVVAAREALHRGLAINLGGGFHHAKPNGGEGFSIYADIPIAIAALHANSHLAPEARIAYIDLDAHQGNGVCYALRHNPYVTIFDMYNSTIYPAYDVRARERIDVDIPLTSATTEAEYLELLESRLPTMLDEIELTAPVELAIYTAGTDVFAGDPLGGLNLSAGGVLRRDRFTIGTLRARNIPTVMLTSGGYTQTSYKLIADSVIALVEHELGGGGATRR